jgi:membrane protease YdiL (CAAX protease family)
MTFAPPAGPPPGWYDDPWSLAPERWWDGQAWSWQVQAHPPRPAPAAPTVPIEAGLWGLLAITAVIVALHIAAALVAPHLPVVVAVILVTVALYGPMAAYCVYASRRWASGRLSVDYGARVRPIDLAIGLAAVLAAFQAERIAILLIELLHLPVTGNADSLSDTGDRGLYLTLAGLAIVAAPLVEELFFRGLLLSALRSRMGPVAAVAVQAVVFGAYHAGPVYGWGNIGLVIILSVVGAVFGATAQLTRRLGAGMIAHALFNAAVFAVLLTR